MAKRKIEVKLLNFGLYSKWDRESKDIPDFKKFTTSIPAQIGVEFGYVLEIRKAKNKKIHFTIEHPPFPDSSGEIAPPFEGDVFITSNDYKFFLGDTIWEPTADKVGIWRLICRIDGHIVADKSLEVVPEFVEDADSLDF